jgi:uncharacterized protein
LSSAVRLTLGGLDFIPDLSGALFCPDFKALLVADLHLEKASSLARRGVHLPPYDTRATIEQLKAAIAGAKPDRLICLGDSFHDCGALERIAPEDAAALKSISTEIETLWISGNHDAGIRDLPGAVASRAALGPISLRHIPENLAEGEFEIAGHFHPSAAIVQRGRRLRCKCFAASPSRILMPAFGSFTGGLDVRSAAVADLFPGPHDIFMMGRNAIHRVPSTGLR